MMNPAIRREKFGRELSTCTAILTWLCAAAFLFTAVPALAAQIEVSLDRNPVPLNESFTLIFTATETPESDPDFSPLNTDFEILGQSQSSQFSLVNGRSSKIIEWRLTVMAKRAGTLTIPPIAFGDDRSEPFVVTVTRASAAGGDGAGSELFMEVEAEPKNPYVQAQVIYTVRILSRVPFSGDLEKPEAGDALIEKLGDDLSYATLRNGMQYRVTERKYAIFFQKSGRLRIEPLRLEAHTARGGRSFLNPLFNQAPRTQRVISEALELDVRPVPAAFSGKHWLPAEELALEDSWSGHPPQIGSGEPITRTLTLRAKGATVGLLPELNRDSASHSADLKQYPDQPLLNEEKLSSGLASLRQEKAALIVAQPGTYRLPAVEIPWWNTQSDRPETARLPERILTVLPPAHAQSHEPSKAAEPDAKSTPKTEPAPSATPATALPPAVQAPSGNLWFWLAMLFSIGWLSTAAAWWWLNRRPAPAVPEDAPSTHRRIEAVERACRANDPAAARRALAAWTARHWPDVHPADLEELERRCGGELGREIGALNRILYGRGGMDWRGQALWQSFRTYIASDHPAGRTTSAAELEPLYKL